VLLKYDVQGWEPQALAGAEGILDFVAVIQTELSSGALYDGQPDGLDLARIIERRGFRVSIDRVH
jgi:hypothetical protein